MVNKTCVRRASGYSTRIFYFNMICIGISQVLTQQPVEGRILIHKVYHGFVFTAVADGPHVCMLLRLAKLVPGMFGTCFISGSVGRDTGPFPVVGW